MRDDRIRRFPAARPRIPGLLGALALLAGACSSSPSHPGGQLTIVSPTNNSTVCDRDDINNTLPGIQVNVTVMAQGVADGTLLSLSENGASVATQSLAASKATFSAVTVGPNGMDGVVSLVAATQDGSVSSPPVVIVVNTKAPLLKFQQPLDGSTIGLTQSKCPSTPGMVCYDVIVFSDAEDGQRVGLTLIDAKMNMTSQTPVPLSGGQAVFPGITFTAGAWMLQANVTNQCGNPATASASVTVVTNGPPCTVSLPPPVKSTATYPAVLNISTDGDVTKPGEQHGVQATSSAGATLTLRLDGSDVATGTADATGAFTFAGITFPEGSDTVEVVCQDTSNNVAISPTANVFVDTVAPVCALGAPKNGALLSTTDDVDASMPGVQIDTILTTTASDVDGETDAVTVNGGMAGSAPVMSGMGTVEVTLVGGSDAIVASSQDHAGNPCSASANVTLDTMGCAVQFADPTSGMTLNQSQNQDTSGVTYKHDVSIYVDAKCIGQTATLTLGGVAAATATVAADGTSPLGASALFPMTQLCGGPCEKSITLGASVPDAAGTPSNPASATIFVDDTPPNATLSITNPSVSCGATVGPSVDVDGNPANGVQIDAQIITESNVQSVTIDATNGSSKTTYTAPKPGVVDNFLVTIGPGITTMVGKATDAAGNPGTATPNPCTINLQNIAVNFTNPTSGADLGSGAGTVSGSSLTINVTGTASGPSTVTLTEGASTLGAATVSGASGGAWAINGVAFAQGTHTITATAAGGSGAMGSTTITFTVDLTPPAAVSALSVAGPSRGVANVSWTSPASSVAIVSYDLRWSTMPITASSFASATSLTAPSPAPAGTMQSATLKGLKLGTSYYFAIETVSMAGNRSALTATTTPFTPALTNQPVSPDRTGTVTASSFGSPVVSGDFNGDGVIDLAVGGAGFAYTSGDTNDGTVQIYFGSKSSGGAITLPATPSVVIRGTKSFDNLGVGLAALDFNGDGVTDLAITRFTSAGGFVVFFGGSARWTSSPLLDTDADLTVTTDSGSLAGFILKGGDVDGDGIDDLLLSAILDGPNGTGAAYLLYGSPSNKQAAPYSVSIPSGLLCTSSSSCGPLVGWRYGFDSAPANSYYGDTLGIFGHPTSSAKNQMLAVGSYTGRLFTYAGAAPPTTAERTCASISPPCPLTVLDSTATVALASETGNLFAAIGGLHDINGDGADELVLGDPTVTIGSNANSGRVYIVSGAATGGTPGAPLSLASPPAGVLLTKIDGSPGGRLGASIAWQPPAGRSYFDDLNGDGVGDLAIMGPTSAYVFYGSAPGGFAPSLAATNADFVIKPVGIDPNASSIFNIADINGDGLPDLAVGDPIDAPGVAVLYY